jgi:hypothetical protein
LLNLARKQITKKTKTPEGEDKIVHMTSGRKREGAIAAGNMRAEDIATMKKLESLMTKDASWLSIGLKK